MKSNQFNKQWFKKHLTDPYVKLAQQQGFRSRAAYKLIMLNEKDHLFHKGQKVLDLGAAPGAWSQFVKQQVGDQGEVCAIDLLPLEPIPGVLCLQCDASDEAMLQQLYALRGLKPFDIVISDMAPNLSGLASIDQPRIHYLMKLGLEIAAEVLKKKGCFLVKAFHGKGFDVYVQHLRTCFDRVVVRKPAASRSGSSEVYLVAQGYRTSITKL